MAGITRRQFIQIGAAGTGALALGSGLVTRWWGLADPAGDGVDPGTDGDQVIPTFCELCFWKCGVLAHVKKGRVTKLVGNPAHPLSRGRLCPRGVGGTGLLYDPDRLKKPLVRARKLGGGVFWGGSLGTALDRVAAALQKVKEEHGPEAVALFSHGFGGSWFGQLVHAFGSPNIGAPSYAQCRGPREAGFGLTFGQTLGSPEAIDLAHARCITLIGSHLGENMHNTQVQDLAEAIGHGAELVVVDPRFSVAASKARYWLPVKPGTDIALLLGWMHVMLKEGLYDAEYLASYATGLDELKAHVADKTPEWAFAHTGVEPGLIRDSARFLASFRPASLIHPGRHTTWYGDDSQRARAMAILAALLGSFGRRGGYIFPSSMKVPKPKLPDMPEARPAADRPKEGGYPFADEGLASGLVEATLGGRAAYDIKAWMVYGTNLLQTMPNPRQTIEAIQKLDFLVAIDVLPAEITGWADVVLPESTYLERMDDLWSATYEQPFVALRQPAVAPMYESRPGWWIAKELANRLGLGHYFPWRDAEEHVRARVDLAGLDWEKLKRDGVILGKRAPVCEEEGLVPAFGTPSGKIELLSQALKDAGFDPLPTYYPQEEGPPGTLRLLTGRSPVHTFGRTANNRVLAEADPENEVWINPEAARSQQGFLGRPLADGERVMLVNQDGVKSGPVKVKLTRRIRGDCVFLVHGWGHTSKRLRYARGRGASDSLLTSRYKTDPIMGGTGTHVNFVRLERVGGKA